MKDPGTGRHHRCSHTPYVGGVPTVDGETVWRRSGPHVERVRSPRQLAGHEELLVVPGRMGEPPVQWFDDPGARPPQVWSGRSDAVGMRRSGLDTAERRRTLANQPQLAARVVAAGVVAPARRTVVPLAESLGVVLAEAAGDAFGGAGRGVELELREATRPEFGHYQSNLALRLAAELGLPPRDVAQQLVDALHRAGIGQWCARVEVAGPGFVNLTLRRDVVARQLNLVAADAHLGVAAAQRPERVVVDYSSPNIAKEMHVGHLRSTVIGDALVRILEASGHEVVRQNHLGDWGTQFGMLICQLDDEGADVDDLPELAELYRRARARFDTDAGFAARSRERVVALQAGDGASVEAWQHLVDVSMESFAQTYRRLGSRLGDDDVAGESTYNADLGELADELAQTGLAVENDGALCVFLPGYTGRDGEPLPVIIRKSDGGFGYDATDQAAIRHRVERLGAQRLVYVTDARQELHFNQAFDLARAAGWLPDEVGCDHVAFGTVLGTDGRPFKTRSGELVTLSSLLDEAVARAAAVLDERGTKLAPERRARLAEAIGIGAVKYADLSCERGKDYTFDLDRMCAMDGNTGPYIQYAHARLCSLLARAGHPEVVQVGGITEPAEERLALLVAGYGPAVADAAATLQPHRLCNHLYELATAASRFYQSCPVLRADDATRDSRLALCDAARATLAAGLDLLGIEAPREM